MILQMIHLYYYFFEKQSLLQNVFLYETAIRAGKN